MNDRIQDLKDKLWTEEYWSNPDTDKLLPAQLNRFAELIVKEVLDEVLQAMDDGMDVYDTVADKFGVEE